MKSSLHLNPDIDVPIAWTKLYINSSCEQGFRLTRVIISEFFAALIYTIGVMVSYQQFLT